jgi:hypothetical protein
MQEKSEVSPEILFHSIQDMGVVEFSIKRLHDMIGIEAFPLPGPELSEQLPRLSVTVVDIYHDRIIQILVLAPSAIGQRYGNALDLHAMRRMKQLPSGNRISLSRISKSKI